MLNQTSHSLKYLRNKFRQQQQGYSFMYFLGFFKYFWSHFGVVGLKTMFFELLNAKPCRIIQKFPHQVSFGFATCEIAICFVFQNLFPDLGILLTEFISQIFQKTNNFNENHKIINKNIKVVNLEILKVKTWFGDKDL